MTRPAGVELPEAICALLDSDGDLATAAGITFQLLTVRDDGWPHLAMLSVGELVALGPRTLRLALWTTSTSTRNLFATGKATIAVVLDETGYAMRLAARPLGDLATRSAGTLAAFEARLEHLTTDVVPYAVLESGVRFRLRDPDQLLRRWAEVRAALARPRRPGGG